MSIFWKVFAEVRGKASIAKANPDYWTMHLRLRNRSGGGGSRSRGFRNSLSGKKSIIGFVFGLPFFGMGVFFCWMAGIQPLMKVVDSGSWPEVPAVITKSEIQTKHSSDGTTYKVDINFRYTFNGRQYTGGSYDFSPGASSGYKGKQRIINQHSVGEELLCRVNPTDPQEAVLSRNLPMMVLFVIPFSSIFILVGLGIMLGSLGLLPKRWRDKVVSRHKPVASEDRGEMVLSPSASSRAKLFGSILIAGVWNGFVGVFIYQILEDFSRGRGEWLPLLFMIPFLLVGLGLIAAVFYFILALANPRFTLILNEGSPRLGDEIRLRWQVAGSQARLNSLEIVLEGRESATYRRGTRSVTDHNLFHREVLFESGRPSAHPGGQVDVQLPHYSMHTFNGGNNRIEWRFRVRGSIDRWPDVNETYPFTLRPMGVL